MKKDWYIKIDSTDVPVSEDTYYAFKRPAWTEHKRRKVRMEKERSLERFMEDGYDIPSEQMLVDEIVADKQLLDELYMALAMLTDDERRLIEALYFDEKSERKFAIETKVSHQAVHKMKNRILTKIKNLLNS